MSQATISTPRVGDHVTDAPVRRRRSLRGVLRPILMLGGIAVVIAAVGWFWVTGGRVVSIDDAYVRAAKEALSTDVSGIVASVPVHDGQFVNKGDVLLRLDPRPFEIALAGAKAHLGSTVSTLNAEKLDYQRMLRDVQVKQAQVDSDQADYDRFAGLVKSGGVTRADYDTARFKLMADKQSVEALKVAAEVQLAKLGGNPNVDVTTMSDYLQAEARVDEAQRQLNHTVIYAPFSGVVTEVDTVQPGMYLAAATAAFGLVSRDNVWVEANPKETELTFVKPGDPVTISVDTYPGVVWQGQVQSIAPNSGSEFSVLPAQNTSGNWVKVVQRIPVRIKILHKDGDPDLRAGMSVVADIDTGHHRSWHDLYLAGPMSATTASPAVGTIDAGPVPHRMIITLCTVGATLMQALDQTIANVALPYMQGSLSATYDEITWVLTSYITAAAIMTAPVGWLAARFGRKYLFITCLIGFTITSMMCGAAQSLTQMVAFRLLQGVFGAALVPLSQSTMMDIYPIEQRGKAMAIWGVGVMVGPILGPTLGGYLTEMYNWRFVFYINLPFGILATLGLVFFMPRSFANFNMKFDWIGFGVLSLGIGGLQMMLDRGQDQDWFSSKEIIVEAILGGLGVYLFLVHMLTAKKPFIPPVLFKDRNFAAGLMMMFTTGTILVSSSSLMAPWLQNLANYPVETAGLIMAPRGIGTMVAMMTGGRLATKVDPRKLMAIGVIILAWSMWEQTGWTPDVAQWRIIVTIMMQGLGLGFVFLPLQVLAFATLAPQYRTDGTSLFSLFRNIGAAIGVSVTSSLLARNTQVLHEQIGASVTPFNRALQAGGAVSRMWNPATVHGASMLDQMVNAQAQIIAYIDDYRLMIFTTLPSLLLLLLLRRPRLSSAPAEAAHAALD